MQEQNNEQWLAQYFDRADELAFFLRIHAEWHEASWRELREILLALHAEGSRSPLFLHYNLSLEIVLGILSNPLFTRTHSEGYRRYIQDRIDEVRALQRLLYPPEA